jgi:general stress protein 26
MGATIRPSGEGMTMSQSDASADRVWALIEEIQIAMVATHDGHGDCLRARPMAAHPAREENAIYFLTDVDAGKVDEVSQNDNVCLAFADQKGRRYVSVTGQAKLSNDRDRIKELWSVADQAFWRDENDPAIRVLRVAPNAAEFWESGGDVLNYVKIIISRVTGGEPHLHDNEKVMLSRPLRS